jgi:hypothetical protein
LLDYLEDVDSLWRYPLPTQAAPSVEYQWLFMYNARIRKQDWRVTTEEGGIRGREFTVVGTRDSNDNLHKIVTLPNDQADALWTPYAAFKDDAFGT